MTCSVLHAQSQVSVEFKSVPDKLSDILELKIHKAATTRVIGYLECIVLDDNRTEVVKIKTEYFELPNNIVYTSFSQFNKVEFVTGTLALLQNPAPGSYTLEVNLYDYNSRIQLSRITSSLQIAELASEEQGQMQFKPTFDFGGAVKWSNEQHWPKTGPNEYKNFMRTEISPSISVMDFPFQGSLILSKNIYEDKFGVESYSFGIDPEALQEQLREKARQKIEKTLEEQDLGELEKLKNVGYQLYTGEDINWQEMLEEYGNDSIRKVMQLAKKYGDLDSIYSTEALARGKEELDQKIMEVEEKLKDTLAILDTTYRAQLSRLKANYESAREHLDEITAMKASMMSNLEKYKDMLENEDILKQIKNVDPLRLVAKDEFMSKYINEGNLGNVQKFASGIQAFALGNSVINWENQAAKLINVNGYNIKYNFKNISFASFAGVKSPGPIWKTVQEKDSLKNFVIAADIGIGQPGKKHLDIYYEYNNLNFIDSTVTHKHMLGMAAQKAWGKRYITTAELSISRDRNWGGHGSVGVTYSGKSLLISQNVAYNTSHFESGNYFNNANDDLNSNTRIEKTLYKDILKLNLYNNFIRNFTADSANSIIQSNNASITISYRQKGLPGVQIGGGHYTLKVKDHSPSNQIHWNIYVNHAIDRKDFSYNTSISYQYFRKVNYINFNFTGPALELNYSSIFGLKQNILRLSNAISLRKTHQFVLYTDIAISNLQADSVIKVFSNSLMYEFKHRSIQLETVALFQYNDLAGNIVPSFSPMTTVSYQVKRYASFEISFAYFMNQVFLDQEVLRNDYELKSTLVLRL